jgi:RNA polymerase sigma-70 factor (ECF subfamily)
MSGESVPLRIPLPRVTTRKCEASTLYDELRKPLLRYVVSIGLSRDEAQDVVQDAFVALERHLAAGGADHNLRSWMYRVAHNEARNHQKSYGRRYAAPLEDALNTATDRATPEQEILQQEKFRHVAAAIRLLTVEERECLLLRSEGLRYREIAEVLRIAPSTVGDTVERAIRKLAEKANV